MDGYDSSPSHYNELPGVPFDISMDNKISPAIVHRGVTVSERSAVIWDFSDLRYLSFWNRLSRDRSLLAICFLLQHLHHSKLKLRVLKC